MRSPNVARALSLAAALVVPRVALACPACLGADAKNAAFLKIGSLFVLVPFAVVAVVLYVLRQAPVERGARSVGRRGASTRS